MTDSDVPRHIPWIGTVYRHVAAGRNLLDFSYAGLYGKNRWNSPGQQTLYFAGDIGVAIAEWGRRYPVNYPDGSIQPVRREVFRLHLRLTTVVDLRAADTRKAFGISGHPEDFRDMSLARAAACQVREHDAIQAMLVPSIAFLDDLTRWNLVVFLEKMPRDAAGWITGVDRVGPLSWTPESGTQ